MPRRKRLQLTEQKLFFVTSSTQGMIHYFRSDEMRYSLLNILRSATTIHHVRLYGYVLMSNHFHLLSGVDGGGPQLSQYVHSIKSFSAHSLFPRLGNIWQEGFDDVAIFTTGQFSVKLSYIHQNPVKAGLVEKPEDYPYSSASNWAGVGGLIDVCCSLDE